MCIDMSGLYIYAGDKNSDPHSSCTDRASPLTAERVYVPGIKEVSNRVGGVDQLVKHLLYSPEALSSELQHICKSWR